MELERVPWSIQFLGSREYHLVLQHIGSSQVTQSLVVIPLALVLVMMWLSASR